MDLCFISPDLELERELPLRYRESLILSARQYPAVQLPQLVCTRSEVLAVRHLNGKSHGPEPPSVLPLALAMLAPPAPRTL